MLISAERMLQPDGRLVAGWVRVEHDVVAAAGEGDPPAFLGPPERTVTVLAPGFVDIHCHGGAGATFSTTDQQEVVRAILAHRRHGTTTMVASLVSQPIDVLAEQLGALAELTADGLLAGVHLEGPWLSPHHCGAHDRRALGAPHPGDVGRLLAAGRGAVRMVTLAPELPGALDAVHAVTAAGVTVAVGHTDADHRAAQEAVDAGARVATHLFNAMRPLHHREPGPVPALLADARVTVELIADGVHVHPAVLALAARSARGGFALVSDATAAAFAPDGAYRLGSVDVTVVGGVPRRTDNGAIAGSTLSLDRAVRVMLGAGVPLASALLAASTVPAAALGLDDVGSLQPGRRADLVTLTDDLEVVAVMHHGVWT